MITAILSILILTCVVLVLNKKLPFQICPICAGVSLTWLWMLFGMGYGLLSVEKYQLVTAILMGGSVVGITNKVEEKWKIFSKSRNTNKALQNKLKDCC